MIVSFISISQIYEWITMITIIIWQNKKDLTQAIIELDDEVSKQAYIQNENMKKYIYRACLVLPMIVYGV